MPDPVEATDSVAFDAAFAEALGGEPTADKVEEPVGGTSEVAAASAEPVEETTPPAGAEPGATPSTPLEEPPAPSPASSPAPALPKEVVELQATVAKLTEQLAAATKPAEPQETPPASPEVAPGPTAEELAQFAEDWPAVSAMLQKNNAGLLKQVTSLLENLLAPVKAELTQKIDPLIQSKIEDDENAFKTAIIGKHPDAFTLMSEMEKWVAGLPTFQRVGADAVLNKGTAQDVIDLFDTFKTATGRVVPPVVTPPATPTPAPHDAQSRRDRMRAVNTSRPEPASAGADVNDYDGAFDQAVGEMKK